MSYHMYPDPVQNLNMLSLRPVLQKCEYQGEDADPTKLLSDLIHLISTTDKKGVIAAARADSLRLIMPVSLTLEYV